MPVGSGLSHGPEAALSWNRVLSSGRLLVHGGVSCGYIHFSSHCLYCKSAVLSCLLGSTRATYCHEVLTHKKKILRCLLNFSYDAFSVKQQVVVSSACLPRVCVEHSPVMCGLMTGAPSCWLSSYRTSGLNFFWFSLYFYILRINFASEKYQMLSEWIILNILLLLSRTLSKKKNNLGL